MAAALRLLLVFDMNGRDTGALHLAHGARDVERAAKARIDVDEQRQLGRRGHAPRVLEHVAERRDT